MIARKRHRPETESRSKKPRKLHAQNPNLPDRLSSLPDSILAHVLSFLDTRSAVKTSVLSKRYELLWTLTPCLDFSFSDYQTDRFESYDGRAFKPVHNSSIAAFESYVSRVLKLREPTELLKFRISLHKDVGSAFLSDCIRYAAAHKVQHLRIRGFIKQNPVSLPSTLLASSSLISLHLHNATSNSLDLPKSVSMPNLKILRLKNFEFSDRNFNGQVFSGCPKLESLVLGKCSIRQGNKLKVLDVNCSGLKSLEIKSWRSPWKCFDQHLISLRAPLLASFLFRGHLARVSFEGGLPSLKEACIDLSFPSSCFMVNTNERKQKTLEGFLGMLRQLNNARFLSLSLKTIEVMADPPYIQGRAPVIFENLRRIKFTTRFKYKEVKFPVKTVLQLLEKADTDLLLFDGSKEKRQLPEFSKVKRKGPKDVVVPAHVIRFLLEISPSLEFLILEIPKESSDQE